MNWTHLVSQEWMKERNKYLCASEIAPLAKQLARSRPATLRAMGKLKARKAADMEPDPVSYGDAAKGHILEPYAVASFNEFADAPEVMFHYDDCIVVRDGIGWSPDAMDVLHSGYYVLQGEELDATACLEIKSYGPEHYYEASRTEDKMKLDERWQIATAFFVCPNIERGYLMLYCPEIHEATLISFDREELRPELDTVYSLKKMWDEVDITELPSVRQTWKVEESIDQIWQEVNG